MSIQKQTNLGISQLTLFKIENSRKIKRQAATSLSKTANYYKGGFQADDAETYSQLQGKYTRWRCLYFLWDFRLQQQALVNLIFEKSI